MTTLPPEGQDPQIPGGQPTSIPAAPQTPPQAPQAPVPPQTPQAPQFQQPQAPQQPQTPQAPQFQQPQAPQYQQPAGGQVPPGGGYQQQYAQQPGTDPVSNITLNYWLSVFFSWLPALIFFLIEKDKGNQQAYAFHRDNLNFSLLRIFVSFVAVIPYIGWAVAVIGGIVLFVFHIMAAAKAAEAYRTGQQPPFIFNIPLIK